MIKGYDDEVPAEIAEWARGVIYKSLWITPNVMWNVLEPELKELALKDLEVEDRDT